MKENFQNAYDTMMKLANNAQNNAEAFPNDNELSDLWREKATCYKFSATLLMMACMKSGIFLDTESKLHPVFEKILDNIKAAS